MNVEPNVPGSGGTPTTDTVCVAGLYRSTDAPVVLLRMKIQVADRIPYELRVPGEAARRAGGRLEAES